MTVHTALAVSALAASILLFLSPSGRGLTVVALVASAVEVAMAFGWLTLRIALPLQLVLGLCIAVPALLLWLRANAKRTVSAAAVLAFVGALQALLAIRY